MSLKFFLMNTLVSFLMMSCPGKERMYYYESDYEPEIMKREVFEKSIEVETPHTMQNAGKIYLKDQLLFLGDTNKGFHIYDNSDPEKPVAVAFLRIPGATDLAIRDNVLYVNQATDLVALSYDIATKKVTIHKRIANTFPSLRSPEGSLGYPKEDEVIVDWVKKKR